MSLWHIAIRSLRYYRGMHWAVILGVAAATATITGALLVGDSVRGSLRQLALDRLGGVDELLVANHFFRSALADELAAALPDSDNTHVERAILIQRATVQSLGKERHRAGKVLLLGIGPSFWQLDPRRAERPLANPSGDEIVINATLATELGVKVGDRLVVRFPQGDQVPAESPLGRRDDRVRSLADLRVKEIAPDVGLGHFQLSASQQQSFNAFVSLETLQRALDQPKRINTILVRRETDKDKSTSNRVTLDALLQPNLEDYGLTVDRVRRRFGPDDKVVFDYIQLTSQRMVWPPAASEAARRALADWNPEILFTYLANTIRKVVPNSPSATTSPGDDARAESDSRGIPYSTVVGWAPLGPWRLWRDGENQPLAVDEIVLNSWAAQQLNATVGDTVEMDFFRPETLHGKSIETHARFRLRAVAPLTRPAHPPAKDAPAVFDQCPTAANDPRLTPDVKGITDQASIDDWDPPFPFDRLRIRDADEDYWNYFRTTPKAFVSLEAAQRLWGSRLGNVTALRVPVQAGTTTASLDTSTVAERVTKALAPVRADLGMTFQPIRRRALAASQGATPFEVLFLSLSFFVIVAALMLVALLFLLGVEVRANELGVLQAIGYSAKRSLALLLREAAIVAVVGSLLGGLLGMGYAWLMLVGLRTWWLAAVVTPFLRFHPTLASIGIGTVAGCATSLMVMAWRLLRLRSRAPIVLLGGKTESETGVTSRATAWPMSAGVAAFSLAAVLSAIVGTWNGMAQIGAFFGCGSLVLAGSLLCLWGWLRRSAVVSRTAPTGLFSMAWRSAGRHPGRSALTMGLIAAAAFLILAMSAFRLAPTIEGIGGFQWVAESDQPVYSDLDDADLLADLAGFHDKQPRTTRIFSLRVKSGDDASCRNLYQATRPTVLGIPSSMVDYFDDPNVPRFRFAAQLESSDNPWRLLDAAALTSDGQAAPVPVLLDKNTAQYALHLMGGVGEEFSFTYDSGHPIRFRVVGFLDNSVLQGKLLIAESAFQRLFPTVEGYRYFLLRTPASRQAALVAGLEDRLSDVGFDVSSSRLLLASMLAIQNTYLSTFQSLGALGLLLGTLGVIAVQLRSVVERRGELALLRAVGFTPGRLQTLVVCESGVLLLFGLLCGAFAALVAIAPHLLAGHSVLPWGAIFLVLVLVVGIGLTCGWYALWRVTRAPLLAALRQR